jgi:hypothetical protein
LGIPKLYAMVLNMWLAKNLERNKLRAKGKARFKNSYQSMDNIFSFTLQAITKEARQQSSKVFGCFVDFHKAFDLVPRVSLFQRL